MSNIAVVDGAAQFDFDSNHSLISPLHNQIDLLATALKAQVADFSFG